MATLVTNRSLLQDSVRCQGTGEFSPPSVWLTEDHLQLAVLTVLTQIYFSSVTLSLSPH